MTSTSMFIFGHRFNLYFEINYRLPTTAIHYISFSITNVLMLSKSNICQIFHLRIIILTYVTKLSHAKYTMIHQGRFTSAATLNISFKI